jgi:hypothetical protein
MRGALLVGIAALLTMAPGAVAGAFTYDQTGGACWAVVMGNEVFALNNVGLTGMCIVIEQGIVSADVADCTATQCLITAYGSVYGESELRAPLRVLSTFWVDPLGEEFCDVTETLATSSRCSGTVQLPASIAPGECNNLGITSHVHSGLEGAVHLRSAVALSLKVCRDAAGVPTVSYR